LSSTLVFLGEEVLPFRIPADYLREYSKGVTALNPMDYNVTRYTNMGDQGRGGGGREYGNDEMQFDSNTVNSVALTDSFLSKQNIKYCNNKINTGILTPTGLLRHAV
jgi:hypothetical protein